MGPEVHALPSVAASSTPPDLPSHQRAAFPVSADEVRHWGGHDEKGPWGCVQPAGKKQWTQGLARRFVSNVGKKVGFK